MAKEPKSTGLWGGDDGVRFDSSGALLAPLESTDRVVGNHRCVSILAPFFFWLLFFLGEQKEK